MYLHDFFLQCPPTVYGLLSTIYCLLSTVYCLLSTVYCLLYYRGVKKTHFYPHFVDKRLTPPPLIHVGGGFL